MTFQETEGTSILFDNWMMYIFLNQANWSQREQLFLKGTSVVNLNTKKKQKQSKITLEKYLSFTGLCDLCK